MRDQRFDDHHELATVLQRLRACIRLLDAREVEYLVPLKRLAAVAPEDAFVVDSRHGSRWSLASLAYPIRVVGLDCV